MSKLEKTNNNNDHANDIKIALLEQSIGYIHEALVRLEGKIDKEFGELGQDINELRSTDRWIVGFLITILLSIIGGFVPIIYLVLKHIGAL